MSEDVKQKELEILEEIGTKEETIRKMNTPIVAVAFSSTFTAVTTFFTSILISKYNDYNPSVNIPTLFLIISTFGFLYATLVYANTNGMLQVGAHEKALRSTILGNIISEYLGMYFLILAIPLIINVISKDPFLRISTIIIDLGGLFVYHISGFSIMERHYKKLHFHFLALIFLLELGLITYQFTNQFMFELFTTILIILMLVISFFAKKEQFN